MSTPVPSVAYLTDVEGLWKKLTRFCEDNPLVSLEDGERLVVKPGATFVFGGDAIDRGPDGQRVVRTLLEARRRQPAQVVLLAGNRDINKLRLVRELRGHPLARTPPAMRGAPRPVLLRWILENTMGAREAFDFRKEELARSSAPVSDEDVVDSYLEELGPGGALRDYLSACQLTYRVGKTLFLHGGLHEDSLGAVPSRERVEGVDAWSEALNAWYRDQLAAFAEERFDADGRPAWEQVIAYQAPTPGRRINTGSVVYGRMADEHNHPTLPSPGLIETLTRQGIHRVVVGHTPSGDCPSLLVDDGFELLLADNSYGRVEGASRVFLGEDRLQVEGEVMLDDGRLAQLRFEQVLGDTSGPLGRQLVDTGQLVKGPLQSGEWLLFRSLPEFRVEQLAVDPGSLVGRALGPARAVP